MKPFINTDYSLYASGHTRTNETFANGAVLGVKVRALTTSGFYASTSYAATTYSAYDFCWEAKGYIA
jgi:hypothetical protein